MTRSDLVALLAERFGQLTHRDAEFAVKTMLDSMSRSGAVSIDSREVEATATSMVVVLTYWLSYEYVRDPRRALEPEQAAVALARGAQQLLSHLIPYVEQAQREHLLALHEAYGGGSPSPSPA